MFEENSTKTDPAILNQVNTPVDLKNFHLATPNLTLLEFLQFRQDKSDFTSRQNEHGSFKWLCKRIIEQAADKTWSQKAVSALNDFEWILNEINITSMLLAYRKLCVKKASAYTLKLAPDILRGCCLWCKRKFCWADLGINLQGNKNGIHDNLRCIHMSEAARNSIKECKTLLKQWHCAVKNDDGNDVILEFFNQCRLLAKVNCFINLPFLMFFFFSLTLYHVHPVQMKTLLAPV
ncbi:hypothetical protein G9A89_005012 [Geosiphon pyriformis]|nr:hypothetical protein G9A89_005012 [Geosiphon pyriformis]